MPLLRQRLPGGVTPLQWGLMGRNDGGPGDPTLGPPLLVSAGCAGGAQGVGSGMAEWAWTWAPRLKVLRASAGSNWAEYTRTGARRAWSVASLASLGALDGVARTIFGRNRRCRPSPGNHGRRTGCGAGRRADRGTTVAAQVANAAGSAGHCLLPPPVNSSSPGARRRPTCATIVWHIAPTKPAVAGAPTPTHSLPGPPRVDPLSTRYRPAIDPLSTRFSSRQKTHYKRGSMWVCAHGPSSRSAGPAHAPARPVRDRRRARRHHRHRGAPSEALHGPRCCCRSTSSTPTRLNTRRRATRLGLHRAGSRRDRFCSAPGDELGVAVLP